MKKIIVAIYIQSEKKSMKRQQPRKKHKNFSYSPRSKNARKGVCISVKKSQDYSMIGKNSELKKIPSFDSFICVNVEDMQHIHIYFNDDISVIDRNSVYDILSK